MKGWVASLAMVALAAIVLLLSAIADSSVAHAQSCGGQIAPGRMVTAQINARQKKCIYTVQIQQAGAYEIRMTRTSLTDLDPFLKLMTSSGVLLAQDDDSAGNYNSRIVARLDPVKYKIEASGLSGNGDFVLTIGLVQRIEPGVSIRGQIATVGQQQRYQYETLGGETVSIYMTRTDSTLDPWLDFLDPAGYLLISDDDSCGNSNACINGFYIDQPGTYTIVARSYGDAGSGRFELSMDRY